MSRIVLFLLLLTIAPGTTGADGAESPFCVPAGAVRRSLLEYERLLRACGRQAECWEKERRVLESALEIQTGDPHLHRAYQDLFRRWAPSDRDVGPWDLDEWYRSLLEESPENPVYLYAYGRYLDDETRSRDLFQRAIEIEPEFPWAHVGLAAVYTSGGALEDPEKLEEHLGRFIELCPSRSKVPLSYASQIEGSRFWRQYLPRLRAALRREDPAGTYSHYAQIWKIELDVAVPTEYEQVRERIIGDLEHILTLEMWDNERWTAAMLRGYEILGNAEKVAWIEEQIRKRR